MPEQFHKIVILTAPSGAGKTSITHFLMKRFPQLSFSISCATRSKRPNEVDGKDYYFITEEEFKQNIKEHAFAEWEMVYEGKYYGTLKKELERIWALGKVPILDIDVKGAIHVQDEYPINTISIFIEPPSVEALRKRLISRGTETAESLEARVSKSAYELSFKEHFDKVILNDHLGDACAKAEEILIEFLNPNTSKAT
jgi:guanylate kinase